jgi:5-methylcytosine-specific restriction protein B
VDAPGLQSARVSSLGESERITFDRPGVDQVLDAAQQVFQRGLRAHDSAFAPGRPAWTPQNVDELAKAFVDSPRIMSTTFDTRVVEELQGISDDALLLFAELYYLLLAPLDDFKGETKRRLIDVVLGIMREPVSIPTELAEALESGVFTGGVAFSVGRPKNLTYLIKFAAAFLAPECPDVVWRDPLTFRDRLDKHVGTVPASERNSLLYLAFPNFFLPVISDKHRQMMWHAFQDVLTEPTGNIDDDLYRIYWRLCHEQGTQIDFYAEPWWGRWDPKHLESVKSPTGQRAWLVRGSAVEGHDLVPTWLSQGFASLRAAKLRPVEAGIGRDELKDIVAEDYSDTSYASKAAKVDEFHAFLSRMEIGDLIVTTSQGRLYIGTITGPAEYEPTPDGLANLRRGVEWAPNGFAYASLPSTVTSRLQVQYDVVEMTQQLDALQALLDGQQLVLGAREVIIEPPAPGSRPPRPVTGPLILPRLTLPDASDALANELNVDRAWLQEVIELLRDRPQLIFYGPPGTGKPYIAQKLAAHLAGDNVRLVQFHPAYSYEDFFEGYRPLDSGAFALRPGPLRKTVDAARENPSVPYFLIIDEINRGNLAKIFGELYFLLEYRDQNVDLLYATDDDIGFTLPPNVFLIGTMNTADRSIALVDAAMRRRFAFVALHPSEPPVDQVLRRWLTARHPEDIWVADLFDELNHRIDDPDFKIGPSYFMRPAVYQSGGLQRTWRTSILPLLEEHHYGDGTDVAHTYGLDGLLAAIGRVGGAPEVGSAVQE